MLFEDCVVRRNNRDGESPTWGAAGIKLGGGLDGARMKNLAVYANRGNGIWFDADNRNLEITGCTCFANHGTDYLYTGGFGIFIEISPGPTRLIGNTCTSNTGAGICIAESPNVVAEKNVLVGNACGIHLRNGLDRSYQLGNITVRENLIKDWARSAIVQTNDRLNPAGKKIVIRDNVYSYELPEQRPLIAWSGTKLASFADAQKSLGICAGASARAYRFRGPLVSVRPWTEKPVDNLQTRLAGATPGTTVIIPAYGRTAIRDVEGGTAVWVCDLDGGFLRLTLPNKAVQSQVEARIRDFPGTLPTLVEAKLTSTSPWLEAVATKVGPQPIEDAPWDRIVDPGIGEKPR